jgi:hypothetical protein
MGECILISYSLSCPVHTLILKSHDNVLFGLLGEFYSVPNLKSELLVFLAFLGLKLVTDI